MSDSNQPKDPPGPPAEGATRTFRVKIDGWMADLMKDDLEVGAGAAPELPLDLLDPPPLEEPPPAPLVPLEDLLDAEPVTAPSPNLPPPGAKR